MNCVMKCGLLKKLVAQNGVPTFIFKNWFLYDSFIDLAGHLLHIQSVPKKMYTHKVNIPYYNVYTSFLGHSVCLQIWFCTAYKYPPRIWHCTNAIYVGILHRKVFQINFINVNVCLMCFQLFRAHVVALLLINGLLLNLLTRTKTKMHARS
jgi:hypothetical protein